MSPEREQLIRASWGAIEARAEPLARRFYDRLFTTAPDLRQLFAGTDMHAQGAKFMDMLREIVRVLDDPARLVGEAAASGRRHGRYGVRDRDYDVVGAALLQALEAELGDAFDAELKDAWRELYGLVSAVMRRAGDRAQAIT